MFTALAATISIHVPREGHDPLSLSVMCNFSYFNPRAPRGARPVFPHLIDGGRGISIHVPREGHDRLYLLRVWRHVEFQSTCPARGTTTLPAAAWSGTCISIHVPREGHDALRLRVVVPHHHFNPRAPRGARLLHGVPRVARRGISIHVPREGHDYCKNTRPAKRTSFQSTCPARGTTLMHPQRFRDVEAFQSTCPARGTTIRRPTVGCGRRISIHVPREGHDRALCACRPVRPISIHVPREGHDAYCVCAGTARTLFQSTCPARGTTNHKGQVEWRK